MFEALDRRDFLTGTAATGLALGATQLAAAAQNQTPDKVIIGIMGTGGRGTDLSRTFQAQPGVEIAYCCDVDQGRAERCAGIVEKAGGRKPQVVTDFRRILDDRNVHVLVVATCNHWHAPAAILGCAAGKHVYVEKPCSYNPREGEILVEAARKHKRHVQMGNQRRSWPTMIDAMEQLRKGVLGRTYLAHSYYDANRGTIGRGKEMAPPKNLNYELWEGPAPHKPYRSNYLHYNWHWFWHWGNGELGNNGIHTLDLCRWGLGVDYPVRVTSSGGRYRFDDDQETPDTHVVCFEYADKKQIVWDGLSCTTRIARPYHTIFHGERGIMTISDANYTIYDETGKPTRTEKMVKGDPLHLNNFLNAIRNNGGTLNSEIEIGHKSTMLCHLGNIAHRTGRTLTIDPKNANIVNDKAAMAYWTRPEYAKGWEPRA